MVVDMGSPFSSIEVYLLDGLGSSFEQGHYYVGVQDGH
jgi:hypothetical protein